MSEKQTESLEVNRRDFLKGGSFAALMTMLGGVQLFPQTTFARGGEDKAAAAKVKIAVIGLGSWGREILNTLARLPQAEVSTICDTYAASLRRSSAAAPGASQAEDYKAILDNKDITAVAIATPTHQHKDIALAALKAGKHVYCEAPLANSIEDARAMALAARAARQQVFQPGLQMRADPQRHFLLPFIRSGALGKTVMARAQWHKKQSWRAPAPNPEREKALNWRLDKAVSLGLIGEIAGHQIDQASWFLTAHPLSITGFGSVAFWKDGRDVADTVQALFEFPGGVYLSCDCTLANSFEADYEMYYGSDAAVMLRDNKAWMFKEVDSPLLGWEVYARKDAFYKETGIMLVANATKLAAQTDKAVEEVPYTNTPLSHALGAFLEKCASVDDFIASYGSVDAAELQDHLAKSHLPPAATYVEGFQAAVTAVKANEAIITGQRIALKPEWYELG